MFWVLPIWRYLKSCLIPVRWHHAHFVWYSRFHTSFLGYGIDNRRRGTTNKAHSSLPPFLFRQVLSCQTISREVFEVLIYSVWLHRVWITRYQVTDLVLTDKNSKSRAFPCKQDLKHIDRSIALGTAFSIYIVSISWLRELLEVFIIVNPLISGMVYLSDQIVLIQYVLGACVLLFHILS